jgi:hypothetical protein
VLRPSDIQVPPNVAMLAEEQGWTYGETLDVSAPQSIVARRSRGRRWQPACDELLALADALLWAKPENEKKGK